MYIHFYFSLFLSHECWRSLITLSLKRSKNYWKDKGKKCIEKRVQQRNYFIFYLSTLLISIAFLNQINEFTIFTPDGIFKEQHIQTIFSFNDLERTICTKTKFRLESIYDEFTFDSVEKKSNRAHFILKKNHN